MTALHAMTGGWHVWEVTEDGPLRELCQAWDGLLAAVDGKITQTTGWVEYALATDYRRALLIAAVDTDGTPLAAAVGFMSVPRWPLSGLPTIRFLAYPSTKGDIPMQRDAVAVCERVARERGCTTIEFVGVGEPDATAALSAPGYSVQENLEYILDLTRDQDALWRGLRANHRRNVRLPAKRGVRVERAQSLESVQTLRCLQVEAVRRHAAKGDPFDLPSLDDYEALHKAVVARDLGRVYSGYLAEAVISAGLFITYGGRARAVYFGSNDEGYKTRAAFALYWQAVEDLSKEGFNELSLGTANPGIEHEDPGSPAYGLHEFKLGFGTRIRRVGRASKQLRPVALRVHRALRLLRSTLADQGKRLIPAARVRE
jgi:hypothetical protein